MRVTREHYIQNIRFIQTLLHYREFIERVWRVTIDDLHRVATEYVANLIDPTRVKSVVVCHSNKAKKVARAMSEQ